MILTLPHDTLKHTQAGSSRPSTKGSGRTGRGRTSTTRMCQMPRMGRRARRRKGEGEEGRSRRRQRRRRRRVVLVGRRMRWPGASCLHALGLGFVVLHCLPFFCLSAVVGLKLSRLIDGRTPQNTKTKKNNRLYDDLDGLGGGGGGEASGGEADLYGDLVQAAAEEAAGVDPTEMLRCVLLGGWMARCSSGDGYSDPI